MSRRITAPRLSLGRVCDGQLECAYHGWRFAGDGRCVSIPALPGFVDAGPSSAMRPSSIASQPSSTTRSSRSTVMRLALWISSRVMRIVRRSR